MVDRKRTKLSSAEKNDIGDGWKAGQSLHAMCRSTSAIHKVPGNRERMKIPICSCDNTSHVFISRPRKTPGFQTPASKLQAR